MNVDGSDGITREIVEGCKVEDAVDEVSFSVYIAAISREQLNKDPNFDAFTRRVRGTIVPSVDENVRPEQLLSPCVVVASTWHICSGQTIWITTATICEGGWALW